jgi:toxin YoeB
LDAVGPPDRVRFRHAQVGYWSRRIDDEHRLVYKVDGEVVLIAQARYHY